MKNYVGFGWSCGSFAVDNAVRNLPITAELYEIIGGVPFGVKNDENIVTTLTEPFDGIVTSAENIGMEVYRKTFVEFEELWECLFSDYQEGKYAIVLGPVNMQKLFYIPFSSFYSDVDHFLALKTMNAEEICISDSDGFEYIKVTRGQSLKMLNAEGKFNKGVHYCYYLLENDYADLNWEKILANTRKTIVRNFLEARKMRPFIEAGGYAGEMMNAKEINNMLFNTNSMMYRKQLQKDFLAWYQNMGYREIDSILPYLEDQIMLIAKQKYYLKKFKTENKKWCWEKMQILEDTIADIFITEFGE